MVRLADIPRTHLAVYALLYLIVAMWLASYLACLWFRFHGTVWPHHIVIFFARYYPVYEHVRLPLIVCVGLSLVPLLGLLLRKKEPVALHGDARWANATEINAMNLFNNEGRGIILSQVKVPFKSYKLLLQDNSVEHVLVVAPTRSGKGVGIVVPNLLTWHGSTVVLDVKFENYDITSRYRGETLKNEVYMFGPGQINSHRWNPLDLIDMDDVTTASNMINTITNTLIADQEGSSSDPMWNQQARSIFKAAIMANIAVYRHRKNLDPDDPTNLPPSIGRVNAWIRRNSEPDAMEKFLQVCQTEQIKLPTLCEDLLIAYKTMPEKTLGSVKTTVTAALTPFDDEIIDLVTSESDFDIRDLRKRKITIYLGANMMAINTLGPIFALFFQLISIILTTKLPDKKQEKEKVLLLMDEFTSMGKMDAIKKGIAFFAGYNMRLVVIIQGKSQLESIYQASGLSEFIANFKYQIIYAPNDPKEAKDLSDSLGTFTVNTYSKSIPGLLSRGDRSMNQSQASRLLIMPDEVLRLDRAKSIVRVEAQRPILADKVIYYDDKRFAGRYYNLYDKDSTTHLAPEDPPALLENKKEMAAREQAEEQIRQENIQRKKDQAQNELNQRKARARAGDLDNLLDEVQASQGDGNRNLEDTLRQERAQRKSLADTLRNNLGLDRISFDHTPVPATAADSQESKDPVTPGTTDRTETPETSANENLSLARNDDTDSDYGDDDISRPQPQPPVITGETTSMDAFLRNRPQESEEQDSDDSATDNTDSPGADSQVKEKDGRTNLPQPDLESFQHGKHLHGKGGNDNPATHPPTDTGSPGAIDGNANDGDTEGDYHETAGYGTISTHEKPVHVTDT